MTQMNVTESTKDTQVINNEDNTIVISEQTPESIYSGKTRFEDIGLPEEIAGAAVFLAAPAGNFITGQSIIVDGGVTSV